MPLEVSVPLESLVIGRIVARVKRAVCSCEKRLKRAGCPCEERQILSNIYVTQALLRKVAVFAESCNNAVAPQRSLFATGRLTSI
jgi:hypothetical protein